MATKTAKLHEILAVEGDLESAARKLIEEATNTFAKKPDHFLESDKRLEMFAENRKNEETQEHKALVTTVADKLEYVKKPIAAYLNVFATKEKTNQIATADLVVGDQILATSVPATALLGLETKLKSLRDMYAAIPTLAPGHEWKLDAARGPHIYKAAQPDVRMRTEKQIQHKVLYDATKEHPAQIEKWSQDVAVGKIVQTVWSGMVTPAEKSDLLGRLDELIRATKKARQRANAAEVVRLDIGDALISFVHGSKLKSS